MLDVWEAAVLVSAGVLSVSVVSVYRENQLRTGYKTELDTVYTKLRAAEAEIIELKTQVATLYRLVGHTPTPSGIVVNAGGDATFGGDAVGGSKR